MLEALSETDQVAKRSTNKSELLESGVPHACTPYFASYLSLLGALKKFTFVFPTLRVA